MASMNIYLPEELKERMAKVEANWSEICREAIERELQHIESESSNLSNTSPDQVRTQTQWTSIPVTQELQEQDSIVRLSDIKNSSQQNVMSLSNWMKKIRSNVSSTHAITGQASSLLYANYNLDLLIPGQPWRCGKMKMDLVFSFRYVPEQDEVVAVQDAE